MKVRVLIAALVVGSMLVVVSRLATSYVAVFHAATALPKLFIQSRSQARASVTTVPGDRAQTAPREPGSVSASAQAEPEAAAVESHERDGEHALHAAMQRDPGIAALVNDDDPKVRGAILDFFADDPKH